MSERSEPTADPLPEPSGDDTARSPEAAESLPDIASDRALVVTPDEPETTGGDGWLSRLLVRLGLKNGPTLREDLTSALAEGGEASDAFTVQERTMLNAIMGLREVRVEDVMVPRGDIHAIPNTASLGELLQVFEETGHSRMPIHGDTLDDPLGMVHIRDLMFFLTRRARKRSRKKDPAPHDMLDLGRVELATTLSDARIMRTVLFVPPSMLAMDLLARMQATRTQMALVIDEYGGTDGLVSLEDIVEEVVGDIEDEHDIDEAAVILRRDDITWDVDARAEIDDLEAAIGPSFAVGETGEEVDTLGGLVFTLAGHIPVRGEVVTGVPGWEFRITDADPRRVRRVQIVQRRGARPRGGVRRIANETATDAKAARAVEGATSPAEGTASSADAK